MENRIKLSSCAMAAFISQGHRDLRELPSVQYHDTFCLFSTPGGIQTPTLLVRSQALCSVEATGAFNYFNELFVYR